MRSFLERLLCLLLYSFKIRAREVQPAHEPKQAHPGIFRICWYRRLRSAAVLLLRVKASCEAQSWKQGTASISGSMLRVTSEHYDRILTP